ncbi:MAG: hypothetical protein HF977_06100 [ANME-2 cluster archaeon]|nr:hypothetical protein [ANME-2 cluster archaeon]
MRILWGDVGVSQGCGFKEELIIEHPQLSIDLQPPSLKGHKDEGWNYS